jgi:hypothetical protein
MLAGCGVFFDPDQGGGPIYETTTVSVTTRATVGRAIHASPLDIASAELIVAGEDEHGDYQDELAREPLLESEGVWLGTVSGLSIGPELSFSVHAYDSQGSEIYSGTTVTSLSAGVTSVMVPIFPVDPVDPNVFPVIESISVPADITSGGVALLEFTLRGNPSEELQVSITASAGDFDPAAATPVVDQTGYVTIQSSYTAPAEPGILTHSVSVTNSQGNTISGEFSTTIVADTGRGAIATTFAPSITRITARREGSRVFFTAETSNDVVSFLWSFDDPNGTGAAFDVSESNPGELAGYDETVVGTVSLQLTDTDGLTTWISFALAEGLFPDGLAQGNVVDCQPATIADVRAALGPDLSLCLDDVIVTAVEPTRFYVQAGYGGAGGKRV